MLGGNPALPIITPLKSGLPRIPDPKGPSPEVTGLGRGRQGDPESPGKNLEASGPWDQGCSSDNTPTCVSCPSRLLEYLLSNQPRNSIVQDKNTKHWVGACCFFFAVQIPLGPGEGSPRLCAATPRTGRGRSWPARVLFPTWTPRSKRTGPQAPKVRRRRNFSPVAEAGRYLVKLE